MSLLPSPPCLAWFCSHTDDVVMSTGGVQVEPFNRALKTLQCDVMINGRRRDHGFERAQLEVVEEGSPIKCNPLAWWEFKDCWDYIHKHGLQYHPLHDEVGMREQPWI